MSRPKFVPTDEQRRMVQMMAGFGAHQDGIARKLKLAPKTLRSHFRHELDCGALDADMQVLNSLFKLAVSGKSTAAAIFWAKTRCGWRQTERERPDSVAAEEAPPQFHFVTEEPSQ